MVLGVEIYTLFSNDKAIILIILIGFFSIFLMNIPAFQALSKDPQKDAVQSNELDL